MGALIAIKLFFSGALSTVWAAFKSFFGALNAQGWVGLIGCALLTFGFVHQWGEARHWHKQSDRNGKLYQNELDHEAKIAKQAVDLKARIDALTSSITMTLKERNDAQGRRIAADADGFRVSGPGKAVCPGNPVAPAAAVHGQPSTAPKNAGPQVPAGDRAAVSWAWLVQVVQEHDELLSKVGTVEEQHRQLEQAWPKDGK